MSQTRPLGYNLLAPALECQLGRDRVGLVLSASELKLTCACESSGGSVKNADSVVRVFISNDLPGDTAPAGYDLWTTP